MIGFILDIQELINNYTLKKSNKIVKIIEPLTRVSGITGFFYYTITSKGLFSTIASYPFWTEEYYAEKYYLNNPLLIHPLGLREGIHLPNLVRDEKYLEMLRLRQKKINADHSLVIINKKHNEAEGFGFFTGTQNSQIYHFYFNEQPILKSFIDYFKSEMKKDLNEMKRDPVNLALLKKQSFFPPKIDETISNLKRTLFFQSIGKKVDWLMSLSFSEREKDILKILKKGKTAKDIASLLHISHRTVEKILENIKNKLHCERRSEIFDRLSEMEQIGINLFYN